MQTLRKKATGPVLGLGILVASLAGCGGNDIDKVKLKERAKQAKVYTSYLVSIAVNSEVPEDSLVQYDDRFFDVKRAENNFGFDLLFGKAYNRGIIPSVANAYNKRFDLGDVWMLHDENIKPEIVNPYANFLGTTEEITTLIKNKVSAEEALKYNGNRFYLMDILNLHASKITGDLANAYDLEFSSEEILTLNNTGISPEEANKYAKLNSDYGANISIDDIIKFEKEKIPYETIEDIAKKAVLEKRIME